MHIHNNTFSNTVHCILTNLMMKNIITTIDYVASEWAYCKSVQCMFLLCLFPFIGLCVSSYYTICDCLCENRP